MLNNKLMKNEKILLSAEIHDILVNHKTDESGITKIAEFILENFTRKNKSRKFTNTKNLN